MQREYTKIYFENKRKLEDGDNLVINCGGAQSSKTWSLLQILLEDISTKNNRKLMIVRKFRSSILIMQKMTATDMVGQYFGNNNFRITKWDIKHKIYVSEIANGFTPSKIKFGNINDITESKDILVLEEADQFLKQDFDRAKQYASQIVIICNPFKVTQETKWLKSLIDTTGIIKSTYKDNPFLSLDYISSLESIKDKDLAVYERYVLGNF